MAATQINGGTIENRGPALEGMISTVLKYGKINDVAKYFCSSKKMKKESTGTNKVGGTKLRKK